MNEKIIAWEKMSGLLPAIVQHHTTHEVLMLGYMNDEALTQTIQSKQVTFYSRSKQRLWVKGETSSNCLEFVNYHLDCDGDALLILAKPTGPTCHLNTTSCFDAVISHDMHFLAELEEVIKSRQSRSSSCSYTASLFEQGLSRIAQKVGEEAVEVVIASLVQSTNDLVEESADLLFHLMILLRVKDISLNDIVKKMQERFRSRLG